MALATVDTAIEVGSVAGARGARASAVSLEEVGRLHGAGRNTRWRSCRGSGKVCERETEDSLHIELMADAA